MGDNIERFTDEEKHDISVAVNVIIKQMLDKHKGTITSTILNLLNEIESRCVKINIFDLTDLRNMDGIYGEVYRIKELIKRHPELCSSDVVRYFTTFTSIPISDIDNVEVNLSFILKLYDYENGGISMCDSNVKGRGSSRIINSTIAALGDIKSSFTYTFILSHEMMHLMFNVYDIDIDKKFDNITDDMKYIIEECVCDHFAFMSFMQKAPHDMEERIEKLSNIIDDIYKDDKNKYYYIRKELLDVYVKALNERYNNN